MKNELDRSGTQEQRSTINNKKYFQRLAAVIGMPLALTVITACSAPPKYEKPSPTPIIEQSILTDEQVVAKEAKRLKINVSTKEGELWQKQGYAISARRPINEETTKEANERIATVLRLMTQSENPFLSQSGQFILDLKASNNLTIEVSSGQSIQTLSQKSALAASTILKDGKIHHLISIDINEVINNSSNSILALELAHGSEHIKNSINIIQSLPPMTPEEIVQREEARSKNIDKFVEEESRAYAWQSRAYINQYGLGFRGGVGRSFERIAVAFTMTNGNPLNPEWQTYVAHNALGLTNWQPK